MKFQHLILAIAVIVGPVGRGYPADKPPAEIYIAVIDFETPGDKTARSVGVQLADSVRIGLRRHKGGALGVKEVIDKLTTREFFKAISVKTDSKKVAKILTDKMAVNIGIYGTVRKTGSTVRAEICCINLVDPKKPAVWTRTYTDSSQRARGVIARKIIEAALGARNWRPPEEGDETEPKKFGKPLNVNGDFESPQAKGWDAPDNAGTFIEADPRGSGKVLRLQTDLERDKWYEYRRKLRLGLASPKNPPKLKKDTTYGSVAGLEGVHYRSVWIKATPGQRYWLTADMRGGTAGIFFPKIFVKGYLEWAQHADALSERSLVELKLTPGAFAKLPEDRRKKLIKTDAAKHPDRYRRECFRWYLACRNTTGKWKHYAQPFPPRGGLPANVKWFQIQIYAYWPPGAYLFDNVHMYNDPRQTAPLAEVKARTKNFDRSEELGKEELRKRAEAEKRTQTPR
ncbi:MAG: hypothetical protein QGG42_21265 [Phycisphaerae bacterium]|jgi:hypothetical protein|nr:hypothetical protein [Phycisphaerae bacterium]